MRLNCESLAHIQLKNSYCYCSNNSYVQNFMCHRFELEIKSNNNFDLWITTLISASHRTKEIMLLSVVRNFKVDSI